MHRRSTMRRVAETTVTTLVYAIVYVVILGKSDWSGWVAAGLLGISHLIVQFFVVTMHGLGWVKLFQYTPRSLLLSLLAANVSLQALELISPPTYSWLFQEWFSDAGLGGMHTSMLGRCISVLSVLALVNATHLAMYRGRTRRAVEALLQSGSNLRRTPITAGDGVCKGIESYLHSLAELMGGPDIGFRQGFWRLLARLARRREFISVWIKVPVLREGFTEAQVRKLITHGGNPDLSKYVDHFATVAFWADSAVRRVYTQYKATPVFHRDAATAVLGKIAELQNPEGLRKRRDAYRSAQKAAEASKASAARMRAFASARGDLQAFVNRVCCSRRRRNDTRRALAAVGVSAAGQVFQTQIPFYSRDLNREVYPVARAPAASVGLDVDIGGLYIFRSGIVVPLIASGNRIGLVVVASNVRCSLSIEHLDVVAFAAQVIAPAIVQANQIGALDQTYALAAFPIV